MKESNGRRGFNAVQFLTPFAIAFGVLISAPTARADQVNVSYEIAYGCFVSVSNSNPWGGSDFPEGLDYVLQLNFVLPGTGDLLPSDPTQGRWNTTGTARVTANGRSVDYSGQTEISLNARHIPGGQTRDTAAVIRLSGLVISLTYYSYLNPFEGFADDSVNNLLTLGGRVDVDTFGCYSDLDGMRLLGTNNTPDQDPVAVPETGHTLVLVGGALMTLFIAGRRSSKLQRGAVK